MKYANDFVDEKFSKILEPNLFTDTVLIPDITFNAQYQGDANAGMVQIYKETKGSKADPQTPAGLFNHADTANTLISVALNNAYRKSKRIYQVTANSCAYDKAEANLALAVNENKENRQYSALACLINEGTEKTLTSTKMTDKAIELRKAIRNNHAKANVVFASVDAFAEMLSEAGEKYTPTLNDKIISTGQVGQYLGMTWFEVDSFDVSDAVYYDYSGTKRTVDLSGIELVIYDSSAFHIIDNLSMMRLIDSENFTGVLAQNEINTGFRISNSDKVAFSKTTQSL